MKTLNKNFIYEKHFFPFLQPSWMPFRIKTLLNCVHTLHNYIKLIPLTYDMPGNTLHDMKTFILVHYVMFSLCKIDFRDISGGHLET